MLQKLNRRQLSIRQRPIKVLQIGEGNFLRGFADWIIDILNEKTSFDGDVLAVQPRSHGGPKGKAINEQDGLYHVAMKGIYHGAPVESIRLITCLREVLNAYDDYHQFLSSAENPSIRFMISNTTEAGISFDEKDTSYLQVAQTFPGKLTAWLYHRFVFFNGARDKGLIHLPCELIENNAHVLRAIIHQYIDAWKLPLAFRQWVDQDNIFCNTLVDRIVPGFPKESVDDLQRQTGFEDPLMVMAEPYYVWYIESSADLEKEFPVGDAKLNVKFVNDLKPYRTQKVRILNGAHTAMVPVAYLKGLRTVKEAIDHPALYEFIQQLLWEEILPTLSSSSDELNQFANDVLDRFRNPYIKHELASIALNAIAKFNVRVLPSLLEYYDQNKKLPEHIVRSLASLIRFYKGEWRGETMPVKDNADVIEFFGNTWQNSDPLKIARLVLGNKTFWERDLNLVPGLTECVAKYLTQIASEE